MRVTFGSIFRNGLIDINRTAEEHGASGSARCRPAGGSTCRATIPSAMATAMGERAEMAVLDQFTQTTDSVDSRLTVADSVYTRHHQPPDQRADAGRRRPQHRS